MKDVKDDVLNIDLNHLTVAEIEEIEERTGLPFDQFGESGKPKGKLLRGIAFVLRRREDPSFTWEEAGNLKVVLGAEPVPTTAVSA